MNTTEQNKTLGIIYKIYKCVSGIKENTKIQKK